MSTILTTSQNNLVWYPLTKELTIKVETVLATVFQGAHIV